MNELSITIVITILGLSVIITRVISTLKDNNNNNIMDGARRRGVGGAGPLSLRSIFSPIATYLGTRWTCWNGITILLLRKKE